MLEWCRGRDVVPGVAVPATVMGDLSRRWYAGRMEPGWRPDSLASKRETLADAGLVGPFWDLA